MTQSSVWELCSEIVPAYGFDPVLILALCEQESSYSEQAVRLEQGFYRKYVEKDSLATTSEILLSCSYGLSQIMGQVLREHGYFIEYQKYHNSTEAFQLRGHITEIAIPKALNAYLIRPRWQIEWTCKVFTTKFNQAKKDINKTLLLYNGGGNESYDEEVMGKYNKLKQTFK